MQLREKLQCYHILKRIKRREYCGRKGLYVVCTILSFFSGIVKINVCRVFWLVGNKEVDIAIIGC